MTEPVLIPIPKAAAGKREPDVSLNDRKLD